MRLKQDCGFQDHDRSAVAAQLFDPLPQLLEHPGVDELVKALELRGVAEDDTAELPSVHRLIRLEYLPPKGSDDLVPDALMRQVGFMAHFFGIDHHSPKLAEGTPYRALAGGGAAGQADHHHSVPLPPPGGFFTIVYLLDGTFPLRSMSTTKRMATDEDVESPWLYSMNAEARLRASPEPSVEKR